MIFINGRFLDQPVTGVQRYSLELLHCLDDQLGKERSGSHQGSVVCLTPRKNRADPGWKHIQVKEVGRFSGNVWEQVDLPAAAKNELLFSPANIGPYVGRRQIVTIHDPSVFAVPFAYSRLFRLKYRTIIHRLGKTAQKIITVSEFSRRELERWCGIPRAKMEVIYEGKEHILRQSPDETVFARFGIGERPFFLAVGSNSPHKNFSAAVRAFEAANLENVDLVITGGSFSKVFQSPVENLPGSYIRTGYISDGELRALYNRAVGLVYPSLYEGFGLPPLEAMACGCPVICSNAASLPEVGGDAVLYCDPTDILEIARQMKRVVSEPGLQAELREKGIAQAEKFSWKGAAERTWALLNAA